jgi:hypothetical protein
MMASIPRDGQGAPEDDRIYRLGHIAMVAIAVAASLIATARMTAHLASGGGLFADFAVFWTAARFDDVYNAQAITVAQEWIVGPSPVARPFVYPPSALLLLKPLQWLDYRSAIAIWMSGGIICFGTAMWLYGRRALLAWLAPMVGLSIMVGQASLFTGAALAAGIALLEKRPILSGVLLGVLGAIKPQLALLVPLALICGRHWKPLIVAAACGATVLLASLPLGPHLWIEWFQSLGGFLDEVQGPAFRQPDIAPGLWFAPIGVVSVGYVWTRTARPELRLVALVGGTCLAVPYMMNYDLATMAPAAAVLLLDRDWRVWLIGFFIFAGFWLSPFFGSLGAAGLTRWKTRWATA